MKTFQEIKSKINEWQESLDRLQVLISKTEDEKIRAVYIKTREELKQSIELLKWVAY